MNKVDFKKEDLLDALYGEFDGLNVIEDRIIDHSRWSIIHQLIFKNEADGKFYVTTYSVGATEHQEESPWEYEGSTIECTEVKPVQVTTTKYEVV